MYIIIGLGNPGKKYEQNRHNVGFIILDEIVAEHNAAFSKNKIFTAEIFKDGEDILVKPQTFMNESGVSVRALKREYPHALVAVVYDDIDIELGKVKCSFGRGSGGHNGVESIIDAIGTEFFRIRVGVRPVEEALLPRIAPPNGFETFLLSNFTSLEKEKLKEGMNKAKKIISLLKIKSIQEIMNEHN